MALLAVIDWLWCHLRRRAAGSGASPAAESGATPVREGNDDAKEPATPDDRAAACVPEIVHLPDADKLDLHAFRPQDVSSVVTEFVDEAARRGVDQIRIIHGKGIGVQRAIVRGTLEKHPAVASFGDAIDSSGWGATVVRLRPRAADT